jgi:DNA-binding NarL/FixJ family response regulator
VARVAIVASYASVRAGLHALLADADDLKVVTAVSGSGALEPLLPEARPDVIVADVHDVDLRPLVELASDASAGIVVLADGAVHLPLLAGSFLPGWGLLRRDAESDEIAGAVRAVTAGLAVLDRSLSGRIRATGSDDPGAASAPGEALTAREREVLQLMAHGLPNKNIAVRLGISPHTAKYHVASILAKLGATSRTEAVTLGARLGYVAI